MIGRSYKSIGCSEENTEERKQVYVKRTNKIFMCILTKVISKIIYA